MLAAAVAFVAIAGAGTEALASRNPSQRQPAQQSLADAARETLLQLPVYDVERIGEGALQVGDELVLEVSGLNIPGVEDPSRQLEAAPIEGENLSKSGFSPPQPVPPGEGTPATSLRFSVRVVKAGKLTLPALELRTAGGGAMGRTLPLDVDVASAIRPDDPKPKEPNPLAPPERLPFPWLFVVLASLAVLALVSGFVYALVRASRRKPAPRPEPVAPPRPEHEVALAALAELERRGVRSDDAKPAYFAISEIVKAYLGRRYGFAAPEMTAGEIRDWLLIHRPDIGAEQVARSIDAMFARLDRVKFSDHRPDATEPSELIREARDLVSRTRRPEAAAGPSILPQGSGGGGGAL